MSTTGPSTSQATDQQHHDQQHVVFAADDIFAMPLAVSAASVIQHAAHPERLCFTVIDCGISKKNQDRIRRSLQRRGSTVRFHTFTTPVPTAWLQSGIIPSVATFARLFIQDYLTEGSRAIYLDSDTIARVDIAPLYDQLNEGMLVAGVVDGQGDHGANGIPRLAKWFPPGSVESAYINAGVMVLDLDAWREAGLSDKFRALMADSEAMQFADQDAINIICAGRIQTFDGSWNVQTHTMASLDGAELRHPTDSPRIIHFTNRPKPWHMHGDVGMADPWYSAIDETEWKGWRPTRGRLLIPKLRRGWRLVRQRPMAMLERAKRLGRPAAE